MTFRCLLLLGLLVAVSSAPTTASADAPPRPATDDARKRAASHYQQGITHYNLGEFSQAVAQFKAAYELSQEPDLLFNIGQAYRLQEDYKQALFFYDAYLRLRPNAGNRGDVEARIAEAKKLLEAQKSLQAAPPHGAIEPTTTPAKAPPPASPPPQPAVETAPSLAHVREPARADAEERSRITVAGWITGAVGVASVATGAYFAMRARSGWDELTQLSEARGMWNEHYADVERDSRRSEHLAVGMLAVGSAAIVTGGVLWYLGSRRDATRASVAILPSTTRMQASVTWRF